MDSAFLEKYGSYLAMAGAFLLVIDPGYLIYSWILFTISSLMFIKFSHQNGYKNMVKQNIMFVCIDIFGIIKWVITWVILHWPLF